MKTIKLIYSVTGSEVYGENSNFIPQINAEVIFLNKIYIIKSHLYDLDAIDEVCYIKLEEKK